MICAYFQTCEWSNLCSLPRSHWWSLWTNPGPSSKNCSLWTVVTLSQLLSITAQRQRSGRNRKKLTESRRQFGVCRKATNTEMLVGGLIILKLPEHNNLENEYRMGTSGPFNEGEPQPSWGRHMHCMTQTYRTGSKQQGKNEWTFRHTSVNIKPHYGIHVR